MYSHVQRKTENVPQWLKRKLSVHEQVFLFANDGRTRLPT
jgi:hypothetical protein